MITVTILTKNCEETLPATLDSLKDFPEVIVYDTGSTDKTPEIAARYANVKWIQGTFDGFGPTHNQASARATYDWILSIDSDEVLTPELSKELLSRKLDPRSIYCLNRHNFFNGKWIRGCAGWYPDPVRRLYNRKETLFSDDEVHEKVILRPGMQEIPLSPPLLHTPYRSLSDFLPKMQHYSTLFAKQYQGKKSSSLFKAIAHAAAAFTKSYFFKRGILAGKEGFIISAYYGHTAFYKYLKLAEANKAKACSPHERS